MTFFGSAGLVLIASGLIPGEVVILEVMSTGLALRIPTAILSIGLVLAGMLAVAVVFILHTVNRRFQELECLLRLLTTRSKE